VQIREPLTEIALQACRVVHARSLREGLDLFEELNRVGLLATEPRIREIQKSALINLMTELELVGPTELMSHYY
jgi:hypothetical protein